MDDFLNDLIDLTICAKSLPRDFDYKFKMLDPDFSQQIESLSTKTFNLLSTLSSYVNSESSNPEPSENQGLSISFDDEDMIFSATDKAVQSLLISRDMDVFDNPPSNTQKKQQVQNENAYDIKKCEINNIVFYFSINVPKPPKFVTPTTTYSQMAPIDLIKPLREIPIIVNADTPQFNLSKVINIRDISSENKYVDEIIRSYPNGPLFVASLNHCVRTYRPFSAFIVVMTPQYQVYVFDILNLRLNLSSLRDLLQNENILKIMYDAGEDVKILAESLNMYIVPLLDVSLIESPLSQRDEVQPAFIEDIITPHLTKCVVDWRIRPLNDELLSIAAQSVWHLQSIANEIISNNKESFLEIINDNNNSWYSFGRMPNLPYAFGQEEAEAVTNEVLDLDPSLSDEEKDIIFELVKWRDSIAVIEEETPYFIATNEAILKIAKDKPLTVDDLTRDLAELLTPQLSTYAVDIILIIQNNCNIPDEEKNDVLSLLNKI